MATDGWFRKSAKFPDASPQQSQPTVPEGIAVKCVKCGDILLIKDFERNLKVCSRCGFHHTLSTAERLQITVDEGSFVEFDSPLKPCDPLGFPEYAQKIAQSKMDFGSECSFKAGLGTIEGHACVVGISEYGFRGGSMGSVEGELITRALEEGAKLRLPVVFFVASGGARMEEGLLSLMQMAKTSAAVARLSDAGAPLITVLLNPTTGGVLASFASLGDVILAEPGAYIAFAGSRVAAQAETQKPPQNYQTAEWRLEHGQVDMVVPRRELRATLGRLLELLHHARQDPPIGRNPQTNHNGYKADTFEQVQVASSTYDQTTEYS